MIFVQQILSKNILTISPILPRVKEKALSRPCMSPPPHIRREHSINMIYSAVSSDGIFLSTLIIFLKIRTLISHSNLNIFRRHHPSGCKNGGIPTNLLFTFFFKENPLWTNDRRWFGRRKDHRLSDYWKILIRRLKLSEKHFTFNIHRSGFPKKFACDCEKCNFVITVIFTL